MKSSEFAATVQFTFTPSHNLFQRRKWTVVAQATVDLPVTQFLQTGGVSILKSEHKINLRGHMMINKI